MKSVFSTLALASAFATTCGASALRPPMLSRSNGWNTTSDESETTRITHWRSTHDIMSSDTTGVTHWKSTHSTISSDTNRVPRPDLTVNTVSSGTDRVPHAALALNTISSDTTSSDATSFGTSSSDAASPDATRAPKSPLIPDIHISMAWPGLNKTDTLMHASMKLPSILLEDIDSLISVHCSTDSVALKYNNAQDYEHTIKEWGTSDFILITNHLGDCDIDNERGFYEVHDVAYDDTSLTIMALASKVEAKDVLNEAHITFSYEATPVSDRVMNKRETIKSWSTEAHNKTIINSAPLTIVVNEAEIQATIAITGSLHFNFWKFKFEHAFVELDWSHSYHTNVTTELNLPEMTLYSYMVSPYTYAPTLLGIAPIIIPGILFFGPALIFDIGVGFATGGRVNTTIDHVNVIDNGKMRLDLLSGNDTFATGWNATNELTREISSAVNIEINPFVQLRLEMACILWGGLLDLGSGFLAKPSIINKFSIDGRYDWDHGKAWNGTMWNVTGAADPNSTCPEGGWYETHFHFDIDAFVTNFYYIPIYDYDLPLYQSECFDYTNKTHYRNHTSHQKGPGQASQKLGQKTIT